MRSNPVQQRSAVHSASGAPDDAGQQVLKIDMGQARSKRLPGWFFAGPRVVELWPPEARPVWGRGKVMQILAPPMGPPTELVEAQAWTPAMQQNTRLWVRHFGSTLGQVNYFTQLQARMLQHVPDDVRSALEALAHTPCGMLLFNVLPQLSLRTLGHTPLPSDASAVDGLIARGTAMLVWPVLLVAPSCCDQALVEAVQGSLSPAALRHLSDFCASDLGAAFLRLVRALAHDPMVMTADMTVRNNLQAGLRDELQAMHRQSTLARLRDMGEQLDRDVVNLRNMLAEKQDLFLRATPELDRTLIALQDVTTLAAELQRGPAPTDGGGDLSWEVALLECVQQSVPRMHACIGNLLSVVGLSAAAGETLSLLYKPTAL